MPPPDTAEPLAQSLVELCPAIAQGRSWLPPPDADLEALYALAEEHGLAGFLYPTHSSPDELPEAVRSRWRAAYHSGIAQRALAQRELETLAAAFEAAGVRLMALKGAAALVTLYRADQCREMVDLDLLVEAASVERTRRIMAKLGYDVLPNQNSPEDERVSLRRAHLPPFAKDRALPVEIHVTAFPYGDAIDPTAPEMWRDAQRVPCGKAQVWVPSPTHFALHTADHYARHLERGSGSLKGLLDLLLTLGGKEIDWPAFWQTARRWQSEERAGRVLATLSHLWDVAILSLPAEFQPFPIRHVIRGITESELFHLARRSDEFGQRLALARDLPDLPSRVRYVFGLVFPSAENLRYRYDVPPSRSVLPYYFLHPLRQMGRLVSGLVLRRKVLADKER